MARRIKMSAEERKRRARERYRRENWIEKDFPSPQNGCSCLTAVRVNFNRSCLTGIKSSPAIDTRLVPPDRKPRRKPEPKRKPDPQPRLSNR